MGLYVIFDPLNNEMADMENNIVCPDIDCCVRILGPRKSGQGMGYYRCRFLMSGYSHESWFAKLFRSTVSLAKNILYQLL